MADRSAVCGSGRVLSDYLICCKNNKIPIYKKEKKKKKKKQKTKDKHQKSTTPQTQTLPHTQPFPNP